MNMKIIHIHEVDFAMLHFINLCRSPKWICDETATDSKVKEALPIFIHARKIYLHAKKESVLSLCSRMMTVVGCDL